MPHKDVRILLIDDSEDQYLIVTMLLSEIPDFSWTLKWCRTYQDGLNQVIHQLYDVAVVDHQLGEQRTGIDLVREALGAGCTTPLIVLTSNQERAVDVAAMQAGAADYLIKGELSARLLERSIRYARERQRAIDTLAEEHALLARRVVERTAELSTANAELARAAQLKDAFLASMSHELRTPLNGILGLCEALDEGIYGDLTAKQHDMLHMINASGTHLLALINDILDLAKIGAGKMELSFAPVELARVAQTSIGLISQLANQKNLQIITSFDSSVGLIQADARSLTQILINLLSNAVKFTPNGGSIGLNIVGEMTEQVVHCTVWDTGIGIADNDLRHIFLPFVQLDGRLSRQYAGTGLGLALVAQLVDVHGGSIAVTSTLGQGSRFTITLPWNKMSASDTRVEVSTAKDQDPGCSDSQTKQARILVVDDNPANLAMVADYLTAKGFQVVVAREGSEAVAQMRVAEPDAIVMDIQMPGMDGLEAIRCIRADPTVAKIPIIALTALAMPDDRKDCLAAGADDYLSKPVSLRTLVETLETRIGARIYEDADI